MASAIGSSIGDDVVSRYEDYRTRSECSRHQDARRLCLRLYRGESARIAQKERLRLVEGRKKQPNAMDRCAGEKRVC